MNSEASDTQQQQQQQQQMQDEVRVEENTSAPYFSLWESEEYSTIEALTETSKRFGRLTVKDLEWWKSVGRQIYQITHMTERSTHGEMRQILAFYTLLNQNGKLHEDGVNRYRELYLTDDKVFDYFMNSFFQECAQYLIDERTFHLEETLELSNRILLQSVYLFQTTFAHATLSTMQMLAYIFNTKKHYFSANNRITLPFHIQEIFGRSKEEQKFLEILVVGQEVDAVKIDTSYQKQVWSRATIDDFIGEHVYLRFRNSSHQYNRSVKKFGYELRQKGTQISDEEFDWRLNLKQNDLIDCCDTTHVFYNSTILQVREIKESDDQPPIKQVFVGYRVYDPSGTKKDQVGNYNGWSSQYDEWMDVTHPRIQKYQTVAKKLYCKASSLSQEELVDDYNDLVQTLTSKRTVYACHKRNNCQSLFQIVAVNKFGRNGGFEQILEKIESGFVAGTEWCPIDTLSCLMLIMQNVQPILHKSFIMPFGSRMIESVKRSILESPNSNLRNFTKEKIDFVTGGLSSLMRRVLSAGQKIEMLEKFNLQMALQSFNSEFIKTQLQGLKTIIEVLQLQRNDKSANVLSVADLKEWVVENKLFSKLFGSSKYQLIAKAADFFKFMLNERMIANEHLEILWASTRKDDTELKLAIYKILTDTSFQTGFDLGIAEFFVAKIVETNPIEIASEDSELLHNLTKYRTRQNPALQETVRSFYWKLIENSSEISPKISEEALKNYCDSFSYGSDFKTIQSLFDRCLTQIEAGSKSTQSILKIIMKIIEPLFTSDSASPSKKDALLYLFEEKKILSILVSNIRQIKASLTARIQPDTTITEALLDTLIQRGTYLEFIQSRIEFHTFIFQQLPKTIEVKLQVIHEIWDALVIEALVPREKDMLYKWFSELISNSMNANSTQIDKEDLAQFFSEKLCSEGDLRGMTLEGIACFKSIFCIINEKDKRMKRVKVQPQMNSNFISIYNNNNNNFFQSEPEIRTNLDFDYIMHDTPSNLIGIDSLWSLISLNLDEAVIAKALEFLNNLHTNFDSRFVNESEAEIKKRYYQQAYEYLEKQIESGADTPRVKRCIMLMESILDESEKLGNGGLKSLMSLSKGELITLNFSTTFYSSDFPNNFSFKIYSNDSLIELLYQVGLRINCTYQEVALAFPNPKKDIEPKENGKSLSELRLKNGEKLLVSQKKGPPVKEEDLIVEGGEVNPKAILIFKRWFSIFAIEGAMKAAQIAKFIDSCTHDNCSENDHRVENSLEQYDKDKKGYMNEEDFINFYTTASKLKPEIVRKNVASHGYRKDFKRFDEISIQSIDFTSMPRYILARDEKFFKMIFDLLDRKEVAEDTWRFLSRLPISPVVYEKIVRMESIRNVEQPNWESVLGGDSMYKQLYNLHVIEYLMEEGEDDQNVAAPTSQIVSNESEELKTLKDNWRTDFIQLGGFDYLISNFKSLLDKSSKEQIDSFSKKTLSFILKIVQNYLVATFSCLDSSIYKSVARMSLTQVPLSAVLLALREETRTLGLRRKESEARETLIEMELKRMETNEENNSKQSNQSNQSRNEAKVEESQLFLQLQSNLQKHGLAEILLNKFDFPSLTVSLQELVLRLLRSKEELESEDRVIIQFSLLILSTVLVNFSDVAKNVMDVSSSFFSDLISEGIFYKDNQNIRRIFSHCFFMVGQSHLSHSNNEHPIRRLLEVLMNNIPGLDNANQNCAQYFELFCALLDSLAYHQIDDTVSKFEWLNLAELLRKLVLSLKNHESTETNMQSKPDKIQIGLMNLCDRILSFQDSLKAQVGSSESSNLVEMIFHECLFYLADPNLIESEALKKLDRSIVKCKTETSRAAAFRLLTTLCRNCPQNLELLLEKGLTELMTKIPSEQTNFNVYRGEPRSEFGYVGLRNLGSICYMNAMLQQFFMTPTFRNAILMAQDGVEENNVTEIYNKQRISLDDNVLHQFQQMFSFLEMSSRVDYNPIEFCFSFKDYGGDPVNTMVQQDAQEFLNMIFDKLENGLKQTPFKKILENVYGGKTCSQLICSNCKQVNNRYEQFYNLSLEVKNSNSLTESFERFITGETISDFKCEACEKKVDVRKRVCLSELPNVLIVHLQRIIFDLETLTNIKVNSRLEFPKELDLKPFTKAHLEETEKAAAAAAAVQQPQAEGAEPIPNDDDQSQQQPQEQQQANQSQASTQYKLAGVVVHTGTAEYGHYYSYIDSARGFENISQPIQETWLEFNDSRVRDFSTKNIENECFGGQQTDNDDSSSSLGFNFGWFKNRDNSKNAYILVYERIEKEPIELVFESEKQKEDTLAKFNLKSINATMQSANISEQNNKVTAFVDYFDMNAYVPDNLFKRAWIDNLQFMFEKQISNKSFFAFLHEIANSIDIPTLQDEDCAKGFYKNYDQIDSTTRESYYKLMKMQMQMINHLTNISAQSSIIEEMITKLFNLLRLCPDRCKDFFIFNFFGDIFRKEAAIIKSSDGQFRSFLARIYAECIKIIVNFYDISLFYTPEEITLLENQSAEAEIPVKIQTKKALRFFLSTLRGYAHEHAFKNAFKSEAYFSFWDMFSSEGGVQMEYMITEDVASTLIEIFMGEDSPFSARREYSMSSRSYSTKVTSLTRCIALILENIQPTHEVLSEISLDISGQSVQNASSNNNNSSTKKSNRMSYDVFKFIHSAHFYEKLFSNDSIESKVLNRIVKQVSKNDLHLTQLVCETIVRGLYRTTVDETKIYCEAIYSLLSIKDAHRQTRIEAILGVPSLSQNLTTPQFKDGKIVQYEGQSISHTHYGTYSQTSISDPHILMKSSLQIDISQSLLESLYINRRTQDNISGQILLILVILSLENDDIAEYISNLPSPSYLYTSFVHFMHQFFSDYYRDSVHVKSFYFPRATLALELEKNYSDFQRKIKQINEKKASHTTEPAEKPVEEPIQIEKDSVDTVDSSLPTKPKVNSNGLYTIGKTQSTRIVRKAQIPLQQKLEEFEDLVQFDSTPFESEVAEDEALAQIKSKINQMESTTKYITLLEREVTTFVTENHPNATTNTAYDPSLIKDVFIMTGGLLPNSPWNAFFKSRYPQHFSSQLPSINPEELEAIMKAKFETRECVREYVVVNPYVQIIDLKLEFFGLNPTSANQANLPRAGKYVRVKPRSTEVVYAIAKPSLDEEWGDYGVRISYPIQGVSNEIKSQLHLQSLEFSQLLLANSCSMKTPIFSDPVQARKVLKVSKIWSVSQRQLEAIPNEEVEQDAANNESNMNISKPTLSKEESYDEVGLDKNSSENSNSNSSSSETI